MNLLTYALLKKEILRVSTIGITIDSMDINEDGKLTATLSNGKTLTTIEKVPTSDMEALENLKTEIQKIQTAISNATEYIVTIKTLDELPVKGHSNILYKVESEEKIYQWNPSSGYSVISSNYEDIKIINGGNANG